MARRRFLGLAMEAEADRARNDFFDFLVVDMAVAGRFVRFFLRRTFFFTAAKPGTPFSDRKRKTGVSSNED